MQIGGSLDTLRRQHFCKIVCFRYVLLINCVLQSEVDHITVGTSIEAKTDCREVKITARVLIDFE